MALKIARVLVCFVCLGVGAWTGEKEYLTWALLLTIASDVESVKEER